MISRTLWSTLSIAGLSRHAMVAYMRLYLRTVGTPDAGGPVAYSSRRLARQTGLRKEAIAAGVLELQNRGMVRVLRTGTGPTRPTLVQLVVDPARWSLTEAAAARVTAHSSRRQRHPLAMQADLLALRLLLHTREHHAVEQLPVADPVDPAWLRWRATMQKLLHRGYSATLVQAVLDWLSEWCDYHAGADMDVWVETHWLGLVARYHRLHP